MALLACFFSYSFSSYTVAAEICPTNTSGLCDIQSIETIDTDISVETSSDGYQQETITTTTTTTTTNTVTHGTSGNLLDESLGYTKHGGDQDSDPGGQGSATNSKGQCRSLGTLDTCAGLTSTNLTTYEWNNLDVSGLSMEGRGGEVTYSVAIDVPSSDTTSIMITGVDDTGKTVFTGVDVLSAAGSESIGVYEGGFDFSDSFSKISIKMFGTNYQLTSAYPVFDDLQANIYWNILSTVVTQFITSEIEYLLLNPTTDPVELELVEDFFDHNEITEDNGQIEVLTNEEPIDDITFETVDLELNNLDMDISMDFTPVDTLAPNSDPTVDKIDVAAVTEDLASEIELGPVDPGPKEKAEAEVKEGPGVSKEGPKEEVATTATVKPPVVKKATVKQKSKTAAKIIKKMGDKGKYDSRNQQKVVIMVALLGADLSTYTKDAPVIEDTVGFDFGTVIPDGELPSNNLAMYLMDIGSSLKMDAMIDSQWKD
tara:strand:+ start:459 stop:1913 length:1455 start_codon:yes stop_codon:yes gene_type:complete